MNQETFDKLLNDYFLTAFKQEEWDRMAPVGMSEKQKIKEQKIYAATEKSYTELWEFVRDSAVT